MQKTKKFFNEYISLSSQIFRLSAPPSPTLSLPQKSHVAAHDTTFLCADCTPLAFRQIAIALGQSITSSQFHPLLSLGPFLFHIHYLVYMEPSLFASSETLSLFHFLVPNRPVVAFTRCSVVDLLVYIHLITSLDDVDDTFLCLVITIVQQASSYGI
jgi:hypothetical protein